jgi:hypothetical protein
VSFNVDFDGLLSTMAEMFNGIWPLFAIVAGLGLGVSLVKFVNKAIQDAF